MRHLLWWLVWFGIQQVHAQELVHSACDNCTFWKDGNRLYRVGSCGPDCKTLDLSGKSIGKIDPDAFKGMDFVEEVLLSDNHLTTDSIGPQAFTELSRLRILDLSRNQITGFINGTFMGMSNLEILDLSSNMICKLPEPACNIPIFGECTGSCCEMGLECYRKSKNYAQCRPPGDCPRGWECSVDSRQVKTGAVEVATNCSTSNSTWGSCISNGCRLPMWEQCFDGAASCECAPGMRCVKRDDDYGECLLEPYCPEGWQCVAPNSSSATSTCNLELWSDCTQESSGCCKDQLTCYSRDMYFSQCRVTGDCGLVGSESESWECLTPADAAAAANASSCTVGNYGECWGNATNECCGAGFLCRRQSKYFAQCRPDCPQNWQSCDDTGSDSDPDDDSDCTLYSMDPCSSTGRCLCANGLDCVQRTPFEAVCWAGERCPESWACTKVEYEHNPTCKLEVYADCTSPEAGCCATGLRCYSRDEHYSECLPIGGCPPDWQCAVRNAPLRRQEGAGCDSSAGVLELYADCTSPEAGCCATGLQCYAKDEYYRQCLSIGECPPDWQCADQTASQTPSQAADSKCDSSAGVLELYADCTSPEAGCCATGLQCYAKDEYYRQCLSIGECPPDWQCADQTASQTPSQAADSECDSSAGVLELYADCTSPEAGCCATGLQCYAKDEYYRQCLSIGECPPDWQCADQTASQTPSQAADSKCDSSAGVLELYADCTSPEAGCCATGLQCYAKDEYYRQCLSIGECPPDWQCADQTASQTPSQAADSECDSSAGVLELYADCTSPEAGCCATGLQCYAKDEYYRQCLSIGECPPDWQCADQTASQTPSQAADSECDSSAGVLELYADCTSPEAGCCATGLQCYAKDEYYRQCLSIGECPPDWQCADQTASQTPSQAADSECDSSAGVLELYADCTSPEAGCCATGLQCYAKDEYYRQCLSIGECPPDWQCADQTASQTPSQAADSECDSSAGVLELYADCTSPEAGCCATGLQCYAKDEYYRQCLSIGECPPDWQCADQTASQTPSQAADSECDSSAGVLELYADCTSPEAGCCATGLQCYAKDEYYRQCLSIGECPPDWQCANQTASQASSPAQTDKCRLMVWQDCTNASAGCCAEDLQCYWQDPYRAQCRPPGMCPSGWACDKPAPCSLGPGARCHDAEGGSCCGKGLECYRRGTNESECREAGRCPFHEGFDCPGLLCSLPEFADCHIPTLGCCSRGLACYKKDDFYSQCMLPGTCPGGWSCEITWFANPFSSEAAFGRLTGLHVLDLSNNCLNTIPNSAFKGPVGLRSLLLRNNAISEIKPYAFKGMDFVEEVLLSDNHLTTIGPQAFTELSRLRILDLSRNQITGFTLRSFMGMSNLEILDLSSNMISKLPEPACNIPIFGECTGSCCEMGLECYRKSKNYAQCRPPGDCPRGWECSVDSRQVKTGAVEVATNCSTSNSTWGSCISNGCRLPMWEQCFDGAASCECAPGMRCVKRDDDYGECLLEPYCPEGWQCVVPNSSSATSTCNLELWSDCTQESSGCCKDQLTCYSRDMYFSQCRVTGDCGLVGSESESWECLTPADAAAAANASSCTVGNYGECWGNATNECCGAGFLCRRQSKYFAQCRPDCPQIWQSCDDTGSDSGPDDDSDCTLYSMDPCSSTGRCLCANGLDCVQRTPFEAVCWAGERCPESWACTKVEYEHNPTCKLEVYADCTSPEAGCCATGLRCYAQDKHYSQCLPIGGCPEEWKCAVRNAPLRRQEGAGCDSSAGVLELYADCTSPEAGCCATGLQCYAKDEYYRQCLSIGECPPDWQCADQTASQPPSQAADSECDSSAGVLELYADCTSPEAGCCATGLQCYAKDEYYRQCLSIGECPPDWQCADQTASQTPSQAADSECDSSAGVLELTADCTSPEAGCCATGLQCYAKDEYYRQCLSIGECPPDWQCADQTASQTPSQAADSECDSSAGVLELYADCTSPEAGCCATGLQCYAKDEYYRQCLSIGECPPDWQCADQTASQPPSQAADSECDSSAGVLELYADCTSPEAGCCATGLQCYAKDEYYRQCLSIGECPPDWQCADQTASQTPSQAADSECDSSAGVLELYADCTSPEAGCCATGLQCYAKDEYYRQCLSIGECPPDWQCADQTASQPPSQAADSECDSSAGVLELYADCTSPEAGCCATGLQCYAKDEYYRQCLSIGECPPDWQCADQTASQTPSQAADSECDSSAGVLELYADCTSPEAGCCATGLQCYAKDEYYRQCLSIGECPPDWQCADQTASQTPSQAADSECDSSAGVLELTADCTSPEAGCCATGLQCYAKDEYYRQCLSIGECPPDWQCANQTASQASSPAQTDKCRLIVWQDCTNASAGCCAEDLQCYWQDPYRAQCRPPGMCPSGWACDKPAPCSLGPGARCHDAEGGSCCGKGLECYRRGTNESECREAGRCPFHEGFDCPGLLCSLPEFADCHNPTLGCCSPGLICYKQDDYYSQCRLPGTCPGGWSCEITWFANPPLSSQAAFGRLTGLRVLDLSNNLLSTLPNNAFKGPVGLRSLLLRDNTISAIEPYAFRALWQLERLDLGGNGVEELDWQTLQSLLSLTDIDLLGNPLTCLPPFPPTIQRITMSLQSLTECLPPQCARSHVRDRFPGLAPRFGDSRELPGIRAIEESLTMVRSNVRREIDTLLLTEKLYFDSGGDTRCWCRSVQTCMDIGLEDGWKVRGAQFSSNGLVTMEEEVDCGPGREQKGRACVDVDECARQQDTCERVSSRGACENTDGSFFCVCAQGFRNINGACVDIDECAGGSHNCHEQANCSNMDGGFFCTCPLGYTTIDRGVSCLCPKGHYSSEGVCVLCPSETPISPAGSTQRGQCQSNSTCEDGVMNGKETGVDCGGTECQPCQGLSLSSGCGGPGEECDDGLGLGSGIGVGAGLAGAASILGLLYYLRKARAKHSQADGQEEAIELEPVQLVIVEHGVEVGSVQVDVGEELIFGRASEPPLHLEDETCSRRHAKLLLSLGGDGLRVLTITDLGSSSGTYVDGHRITALKAQQLQGAQVVTFGASKKLFAVTGLSDEQGRRVTTERRDAAEAPVAGWAESGQRPLAITAVAGLCTAQLVHISPLQAVGPANSCGQGNEHVQEAIV